MVEIINRLSECEEMIMKIIWSDSEDLDLKTIKPEDILIITLS